VDAGHANGCRLLEDALKHDRAGQGKEQLHRRHWRRLAVKLRCDSDSSSIRAEDSSLSQPAVDHAKAQAVARFEAQHLADMFSPEISQPQDAVAQFLLCKKDKVHFTNFLFFTGPLPGLHFHTITQKGENVMLHGDLRELADALISGDKHKAHGELRDLAEAIITGDKHKVDGELSDFAEAIIVKDKDFAPEELRDLADALISGDANKVEAGELRDFVEAILSRDKNKAAAQ